MGASRAWLTWGVVFLSLLLLAAAGLWAFTRVGWSRLEAQVAAEIAYEDEQSLARQPELVRALQAPNSPQGWLNLRAAEAAVGLPAARPAPQLSPAAEPARILAFTADGPDRFDATVLRTYFDSAGQTYQFSVLQRYYTPGPGLWERLPPDVATLVPTSVWQGQRLAATLPTADQPLLSLVLPAVEAYAERACADWGCPAEFSVPLVFTGRLDEWLPPGPVTSGPHPMAFDLALLPTREPRRLILHSPTITGYPLDEPARAAYTRGLSAAVLAYIAGELTGTGRRPADYYLDALIAREERRLGLSLPYPAVISPADYAPPDVLFNMLEPLDGATPETETARRRLTLAFLDFALEGQAIAIDGELLVNLHRRSELYAWFSGSFGFNARDIPGAWATHLMAEFDRQSTLPPSALDGLAYQCISATSQIVDGRPYPLYLTQPGAAPTLHPEALSRDGRYVAMLTWRASGDQGLHVFDRYTEVEWIVADERAVEILGWSAAGDLLYLVVDAERGLALMRYRPGQAEPTRLLDQSILYSAQSLGPAWSADRSRLALDLILVDGPGPALWDMAAPSSFLWLSDQAGRSPALSPDGQRVAYPGWSVYPETEPGDRAIRLAEPGQNTDVVLVGIPDVSTPVLAPSELSLLHWSPDGRTLAFVASGVAFGSHLFTIDTHTRALTDIAGSRDHDILPAQFSADGRYLAYLENIGNGATVWVVLRDSQTGAEQRQPMSIQHLTRIRVGLPQPLTYGVVAWSPTGHLLAVSSPYGIYVTDPATSEWRWVTMEACGRVVWYEIET